MDDKKFNKLLGKISEQQAVEVLYDYYYPKIVKHIYFLFKDKDLGEDIAQKFFLKLLNMKVDYYVQHPTSWVYVACDNMARDALKAEKRYNESYTEEKIDKNDDALFEKILYGEYRDKMNKLDEDTRKIMILYIFEGYSLKEIAEITGMSYGAVRQRCSRGIKKLRESLEPHRRYKDDR